MAFVAAFLKEWLDGFGKDSGGGGVFLLFLGVLLGLFCHLDGITIPAALGFITLEFIPGTGTQPQHRYHQQANIPGKLVVLRTNSQKETVCRAAQLSHFVIDGLRKKPCRITAVLWFIHHRIFRCKHLAFGCRRRERAATGRGRRTSTAAAWGRWCC